MPACQRRQDRAPALSIVVPVLNEAPVLVATLKPLQPMRGRGIEVILADGGSSDGGCELAEPLVDHLVSSTKGRANQMNAGASVASGRVLWFLHADTTAPPAADSLIAAALTRGAAWGWFDVRLSGSAGALRLVAWSMNRRARLTSIATGDQGLFVTRAAFEAVGGFPAIPLMEDVALSRRLKRELGAPAVVAKPLTTSSRRWERGGVARTVGLMWWLRLRFWLGEDPRRLERVYYQRED